MWCESGKPKFGPVYEIYRKACSQFKYILRYCKQQEKSIIANKLAQELSVNEYDKFWKNIHKYNCNNKTNANTVDGITGSAAIADMGRSISVIS